MALVVFASQSTALGLEIPEGPPCATPTIEPGLGVVCARLDGTLEVFNAEGESLGLTHGTDPVPDGHQAASGGAGDDAFPEKVPPACDGTDEGHHVVVIYARSHEHDDRYTEMVDEIQALVEHANGYVREAGVATGALVDLKVRCDDDEIRVHEAVLPTDAAQADFSTIVTDLKDQGHADGTKKYWVFYDETSHVGGTANIYNDDRLAEDNDHNGVTSPMYALNFGQTGNAGAKVMMHELAHTMGAVQHSASHSTGAFHCTDGLDVMCYDDGGPHGGDYSKDHCPDARVLDCGKDDYFNATPDSDSYLATHWNIASELNRYVRVARTTLDTLECPDEGATGQEVTCSFSATTADGSRLHFQVDWGDGEATRVPEEGTTDSLQTHEATHTYLEGDDHTITVQVIDESGLDDQGIATIRVDQGPTWESLSCPPAVLVDTPFECTLRAGHPDGLGLHYDLSWETGGSHRIPQEGTVPAGEDQVLEHVLEGLGSHHLEAVVTDEQGLFHTQNTTVQVVTGPSITLLDCAGPARVGTPLECVINATNEDGALRYLIDWGDGNTTQIPQEGTIPPGQAQSVSHTYQASGEHNISATVTDDNGFNDTKSTPVQAYHGPEIDRFECSGPALPKETVDCSFQGESPDGSNLSYLLDWGDGNTSQVPTEGHLSPGEPHNTDHTYNTTGEYTLRLTVTDEHGLTNETTTLLIVNHGPEITHLECPGPIRLGTSTTCTFQATTPDDSDVAYLVDWGDGTTTRLPIEGHLPSGDNQTLEHTYSETGDHTVTLQVTDEHGLQDDATVETLVRYGPWITEFDCNGPVRLTEPTQCSFQATSQDGSELSYHLDWGDGNTSRVPAQGTIPAGQSRTLDHTYATPGDHTVHLQVTDEHGLTHETTMNAAVRYGPTASWIDCPTKAKTGEPIDCSFQGESQDGSNLSYLLDWGDGNTTRIPEEGTVPPGPIETAEHIFASAGEHTLRLRVQDEDGLSGNTTFTVQTFHGPRLDRVACDEPFVEETSSTCILEATSPDGLNLSYFVDWGDGSNQRVPATGDLAGGTPQEITHAYPEPGTQDLTVTVTDENGYQDLYTTTLQVHHRPVLELLDCPAEVHKGDPFDCTWLATHEEGEEVHYTVDWGDGDHLDVPVDGTVPANETRTAFHSYDATGLRTVQVSVEDPNGGNDQATAVVSVYEDTTPPSVEILHPDNDRIYHGCGSSWGTPWQTQPIFIGQGCVETLVTDDRNQVEDVKVYLDGRQVAQDTGGGLHRFEFNFPETYVAAPKTLEIQATDSRGNLATTSLTVIVYG